MMIGEVDQGVALVEVDSDAQIILEALASHLVRVYKQCEGEFRLIRLVACGPTS